MEFVDDGKYVCTFYTDTSTAHEVLRFSTTVDGKALERILDVLQYGSEDAILVESPDDRTEPVVLVMKKHVVLFEYTKME